MDPLRELPPHPARLCPLCGSPKDGDQQVCVICPRKNGGDDSSGRAVLFYFGKAKAILQKRLKSASILGISHPSDGHPQEEMVPDFCWFRPLAHNNQTWVLYWPDLEV